MNDWQIPREDRKRILAGNRAPIVVSDEPPVQEGDQFILSWLRPKAYVDPELQRAFHPSAEPQFWITITAKVRRTKGGWSVLYDVTDKRDPVRMLRDGRKLVDTLERVGKDTEKKFTEAARERERRAGEELVVAALEVRQVLRERVSSREEFRALAGLSIRRLDKEIERLIVQTKRKAA